MPALDLMRLQAAPAQTQATTSYTPQTIVTKKQQTPAATL
jgi:hypothetical protein